jgi:hypothetical protein
MNLLYIYRSVFFLFIGFVLCMSWHAYPSVKKLCYNCVCVRVIYPYDSAVSCSLSARKQRGNKPVESALTTDTPRLKTP